MSHELRTPLAAKRRSAAPGRGMILKTPHRGAMLPAASNNSWKRTMTEKTAITQVYRIVIKATPQAIWDALTRPEWTERYGYGGRVSYEMKAGGRFCHHASAEMKSLGMPDEIITGEIIESTGLRKLVQTWHPQFTPAHVAETATRLTYESQENECGVGSVTLRPDVSDATMVAGIVPGGGDPAQGGGGWPWVLSDVKSLLETGKRMAD